MARRKVQSEETKQELPTRKKSLKGRSKMGSSYFIPNTDPHVAPNSPFSGLEIPWNRWGLIPDEWRDNPYLLDLIDLGNTKEKEGIEVEEGVGLLKRELVISADLPNEHKEWLKALLYGPYTEGFKTHLKDWHSKGKGRLDPNRVYVLENSVLPVMQTLLKLEPTMQNRADIIRDAKAVVKFIKDREWEFND
jgi:hypothetical protein